MHSRRSFRHVKSMILSDEKRPMTIRIGLFRGIKVIGIPRDNVQLQLGLWEHETYSYIRRAAAAARWVIDIGAGNGELSIFFKLRTAAGPIIAIEPWNIDHLQENIDLNGVSGITALGQFLGLGPDRTMLDALPVPRREQGFIKLDADFSELGILQSGERLLVESKPLLLVETHSAALERDCSAYLARLGYCVEIIPNAWWRTIVPEQRPIDHNRWLWAEPA